MKILAIDPGKEVGVVVYEPPSKICAMIYDQNQMLEYAREILSGHYLFDFIGIEMIGHYGKGMPVGAEVFDTCIFIGRIIEIFENYNPKPILVKRHEIKMHFCGSMRAKDKNIRQAILDRFGGKEKAIGRKANPGLLYGIKSHCWPALALAIYMGDTK